LAPYWGTTHAGSRFSDDPDRPAKREGIGLFFTDVPSCRRKVTALVGVFLYGAAFATCSAVGAGVW
jgi:hypothetical protein